MPPLPRLSLVLLIVLSGGWTTGCTPAVVGRPVLTVLDNSASEGSGARVWDLVRNQTKDLADLRLETEASAEAPDILAIGPGSRRAMKDLGLLLTDEDRRTFFPSALDPALQAQGSLAELPGTVAVTHVLYANTAVLAPVGLEPASSWDEWKAQVPRIRAAGLEVVLMANQDEWVMVNCLFSALVGRTAGPGFVRRVSEGTARFTDPPFVAALGLVQDFYAEGLLSKTSLQTGSAEVPGLFASGRAAYLIDGDWRTGAFLTDPATGGALLPAAAQEKIVLTVIPPVPGELPGAPATSVSVGPGYGISAAIEPGSAREKAALAVVRAFQSAEAQRIRLETGGAVPSRNDVTVPGLEPLAAARIALAARVTGSPVLEEVLPGPVFEVVARVLREIGWGLLTPQAAAARVQEAWDKTAAEDLARN